MSMVNVINYVKGPFSGVDIDFYLAEPLMVITRVTLVSLLLIGRSASAAGLPGRCRNCSASCPRAIGVPQSAIGCAREALADGQVRGRRGRAGLVISAIDSSDRASRSSRSRPRSARIRDLFYVLYAGALLAVGLFSSAPIAASCARSAASPALAACTSSICSSAVPNAAIPAICANGRARWEPSRRPARSSRRSAFSASIARSNTMTTSGARRWCSPPGCAPMEGRRPAASEQGIRSRLRTSGRRL